MGRHALVPVILLEYVQSDPWQLFWHVRPMAAGAYINLPRGQGNNYSLNLRRFSDGKTPVQDLAGATLAQLHCRGGSDDRLGC